MSKTFVSRQMKVEDCHDVAAIHTLAWQQAYRGIIDQKFLDSIDVRSREVNWRRGFDSDLVNDIRIVAEENQKLRGFVCGLHNRNENLLPQCDSELWAIYVHPTYQCKGVGKLLFEEFKIKLRQIDKKCMCVWVLSDNLTARNFYEKQGGQKSKVNQYFQVGAQSLEETAYIFEL